MVFDMEFPDLNTEAWSLEPTEGSEELWMTEYRGINPDIHEIKGIIPMTEDTGQINIKGWTRSKQKNRKGFGSKERGNVILDTKNGNFNAKKEAFLLYGKFMHEIFETNHILDETEAMNLLHDTYIEPLNNVLNSLNNRRYNHLRRYNKRRFKLMEVLTNSFNTFYPQVLKNNIESNLVYLYGLGEERKICRTKDAYSFFELSEDHYIIAQLALQGSPKDIDDIFEDICEEDRIIERDSFDSIISDMIEKNTITVKRKSGAEIAELTKKGLLSYNLGKIPPYRIGIDLQTSILQELYLEGQKDIDKMTIIYQTTEPHDNIMNAIGILENMGLVSSKNTVKITPLGRTVYENVIKRAIDDTREEYKDTSEMLKGTAIRFNII